MKTLSQTARHGVLLGAVVVGLLPLGLSVGAGAAAASTETSAAHSYLQQGAGQSAAAGIAELVQERLQATEGSAYVGEVMTPDGRGVTVYLSSRNATLEAAAAAGTPAGTVRFTTAPKSLRQLTLQHQNVISAVGRLAAAGINVVTWGPDIVTGRENMTIQNLTTAKTAELDERFGAGNITLTTTARSFTAEAVGRSNDTPPWNGGDYVYDDTNGQTTGACTTGFGAHSGSTNYLITAGHCFAVGSSSTPDYAINGDPSLQGSTYYELGVVSNRGNYLAGSGTDAELINSTAYGTSSSAIYTGSSSAPQVATVRGTLSSPVNTQVCDSGAFEGEICGLVIKTASECITEQEDSGATLKVCNVYQADSSTGGIAVGQGDSGGPVFRFSGSSLYATGIVTAGTNNQQTCPTNQFPSSFTNRQCFSTLFYTSISSILSEFKLTINT